MYGEIGCVISFMNKQEKIHEALKDTERHKKEENAIQFSKRRVREAV